MFSKSAAPARNSARKAARIAHYRYAKRSTVPVETIRWSFGGVIVHGDQTPFDIGMKCGDKLDCWWITDESDFAAFAERCNVVVMRSSPDSTPEHS